MSTPYIARVALVCPVDQLAQAAEAAAKITANPEDALNGGMDFFSREVATIETGEVTHRLASTWVTQRTLDRLPALKQAFTGSDWTILRRLGERTDREPDTWLESMGLQLKQEETDHGDEPLLPADP